MVPVVVEQGKYDTVVFEVVLLAAGIAFREVDKEE